MIEQKLPFRFGSRFRRFGNRFLRFGKIRIAHLIYGKYFCSPIMNNMMIETMKRLSTDVFVAVMAAAAVVCAAAAFSLLHHCFAN